ncbi:MAG: type II/IV secretion system protein, partial [Deltaproteobacteria bacterium]|nr:type II/IV secretion system protein [Deltaproteobacteria bacterium]
EKDLLAYYSEQFGFPLLNLAQQSIHRTLLKYVPYHLAKKYNVIPVNLSEGTLTVVIPDPGLVSLLRGELQSKSLVLKFALAPKQQIEKAVIEHYQIHLLNSLGKEQVEVINTEERKNRTEGEEGNQNVEELASSVGAVAAVNSILEMAFVEKASDIHIEPQENFVRVRFRVDGLLEEKHILPVKMLLPIVSRMKIISGMNIAEKRAPQDGRISLKIRGNLLDCRASCYPTVFGEKVVIRLLSKGGLKKLEQLGMFPEDCERFKSWIKRPHGLLFVTGPTGSGKSTTLYSALQMLNSIDRNIMSIEDPVENEIAGVNQGQLNNKANMTFASAMRSMLRQDPDVIMVGEVRDPETAEMALRAALTGHLVLSTLHTNTAVGAVSRLINLGIPNYLLSAALVGVLGQRLVRKICIDCIEEYEDEEGEGQALGLAKGTKLFRGKGCSNCRETGFTSRVGIFELFTVTEELRKIIDSGGKDEHIAEAAKNYGYTYMIEDGRKKVTQGITTVSEVLRVTEAF